MGNLSRRELLKKGIAAGAMIPIAGLQQTADASKTDEEEVTKLWKPGDTDFWQDKYTGRFKSTLRRDLQYDAVKRTEEWTKLKHVLDKHGIRMVNGGLIHLENLGVNEAGSEGSARQYRIASVNTRYDIPYRAGQRNDHWTNLAGEPFTVPLPVSLEASDGIARSIENYADALDAYLTEHAEIFGARYYKTITNLRILLGKEAYGLGLYNPTDLHHNCLTHPNHPQHNPESPLNNPNQEVVNVVASLGRDDWSDHPEFYRDPDEVLHGFIRKAVKRIKVGSTDKYLWKGLRERWNRTEEDLNEMARIYKHLDQDRTDSDVLLSAGSYCWNSLQSVTTYISSPVILSHYHGGKVISWKERVVRSRAALAQLTGCVRQLAQQQNMLVSLPAFVPLRLSIQRGMQTGNRIVPAPGVDTFRDYTQYMWSHEREDPRYHNRVMLGRVEIKAVSLDKVEFTPETVEQYGEDNVLQDWLARSRNVFDISPQKFKLLGPQAVIQARQSMGQWCW